MIDAPSKLRMCHRCGFEKSCRDLVISEACDRWRKIPWNRHPMTGAKVEEYACIDDHMFMQLLDIQYEVNCTSIEMNQMRNQFKESHDANITMGAIAVQRARDAVKESIQEATRPILNEISRVSQSVEMLTTESPILPLLTHGEDDAPCQ